MKKIYLLLVLLISTIGYSQTNGISYQALILNPNTQKMPGIDQANTALANQKICLQFVIQDEAQQEEYKETVSTTTDELGMVNLVIGSGAQTGGSAINFKSIDWNSGSKKLKVAVNTTGNCSSFIEVSNQILNAVPFAFSAQTVSGIVGIENGGTNASNVVDAKINLNLGNVDNTSDLDKPISNATQNGLNFKEVVINKSTNVIFDGSSDIKYPSVKALKTYVDNQFSNGVVVDADATNKGKIQLSGDLSGTAALPKVPGLLLKANLDSPAFTGNVTGIDKTMVDLANVDNTTDALKPVSTATQTALNLKANLASPTLTGTPTLPTGTVAFTQTAGNNTTAIATTAFVSNAVSTATTGNFVDLTTDQTIAGVKTFETDIIVNGITVGRGNFNENSNTTIGLGALQNNAGYANTAVGRAALEANENASGNTAYGYLALGNNVSGNDNVAVGRQALENSVSGSENTAIGHRADVSVDGISNSVALGSMATVTTSNTIQLGNTNITNVKTSGKLTSGAITYTNTDGSNGQVLTTNGAGVTSWGSPAASVIEVADEFTATASQDAFFLSQTPSANSKVKMYVNGIRISNSAYSWTETTLTYIPANNGSYSLSANDRIQFDYFINE